MFAHSVYLLTLFLFFYFKDVESKYNQLCQRHSEQAATESEENKGIASFHNFFPIHTALNIKH